jgi:hypothetical protein
MRHLRMSNSGGASHGKERTMKNASFATANATKPN